MARFRAAVVLACGLAVPVAGPLATAGCSQGGDGATEAGAPDEDRADEPPEDPTDVDDPAAFAFGQEVEIVEGGAVRPALLAADKDAPIVFRNTTDQPVEVRFPNPGWDLANTTTSGPIEPGGTFDIEPIGVVSIKYEVVGTSTVGTVQVEAGIDGG